MPKHDSKLLDDTDARLLRALAANARAPMKELARSIGLSGPSATERVQKLLAREVIRRFTIDLDAKELGYTLEAIVRLKPRPGQLHHVQRMIENEERFIWCDKVTGEDCFIARLILMSIDELDPLLDAFHDRAETNTSIVKSVPIRSRLPPLQSSVRRSVRRSGNRSARP
jgi:Lrp/AsnC family transcriptional regulator, leucine-responsive regulatory protein